MKTAAKFSSAPPNAGGVFISFFPERAGLMDALPAEAGTTNLVALASNFRAIGVNVTLCRSPSS
jgi:hypothetical protein